MPLLTVVNGPEKHDAVEFFEFRPIRPFEPGVRFFDRGKFLASESIGKFGPSLEGSGFYDAFSRRDRILGLFGASSTAIFTFIAFALSYTVWREAQSDEENPVCICSHRLTPFES